MSPFGKILDIVAQKTPRKRGQAFVVFRDVAAASAAQRALDKKPFLGTVARVQFARSKSDAIALLDGTLAEQRHARLARAAEPEAAPRPEKRQKSPPPDAQPPEKRREDAQGDPGAPNNLFFVQGLPQTCSEDLLRALFGQIAGFRDAKLVPARPGMALVEYESPLLAAAAVKQFQGFNLDENHSMLITFVRAEQDSA